MPSKKREARGTVLNGIFIPSSDETSLSEHDRALFGGIHPSHGIEVDADGSILIGAYRLRKTGIEMEQAADFEDWERVGMLLRQMEGALQWMIGDWYVHGEHMWGSMYSSKAQALGFEQKTLRDYAYVARNVQLSIRIDNLTFAHHQVVASEEEQMQLLYLRYAETTGITVANLRSDRRVLKEYDDTMEVDLLNMAIKRRCRVIDLERVREDLAGRELTHILPLGDQNALKRLLNFKVEYLQGYDREQLRDTLKMIDKARDAINRLEEAIQTTLDTGEPPKL